MRNLVRWGAWVTVSGLICMLAQGQANLGPVTIPRENRIFFVGSILYPTIQSAVTAACALTNAQVVVPYGSSPTDTIVAASGCSTVDIEDKRTAPSVYYSTTGTAYTQAYSPLTPKAVGTTGAFASATLSASACQSLTVTVTGAVAGSNWVEVLPTGLPTTTASQAALLVAIGYVSASNTVTVIRCNVNGTSTLGVAAITYRYILW